MRYSKSHSLGAAIQIETTIEQAVERYRTDFGAEDVVRGQILQLVYYVQTLQESRSRSLGAIGLNPARQATLAGFLNAKRLGVRVELLDRMSHHPPAAGRDLPASTAFTHAIPGVRPSGRLRRVPFRSRRNGALGPGARRRVSYASAPALSRALPAALRLLRCAVPASLEARPGPPCRGVRSPYCAAHPAPLAGPGKPILGFPVQRFASHPRPSPAPRDGVR